MAESLCVIRGQSTGVIAARSASRIALAMALALVGCERTSGETARLVRAASTPEGAFRVYGPELFVRKTGMPITESRSFEQRSTRASYFARIVNGPGDVPGVTSALVRLNGEPLAVPSDFERSVEVSTRTATARWIR